MSDFISQLAKRAAAHPDIENAVMGALRETLPRVVESLLRTEFAGESLRVYVPKHARGDRQARDALIKAQYNGRNLGELARTHGLSVRQVRRILKIA